MTPKKVAVPMSAVVPADTPFTPPRAEPRLTPAEERAEGLAFAARFSRAHRNGGGIATAEVVEHLLCRGLAGRVSRHRTLAELDGDWS